MSPDSAAAFRFGEFELDVAAYELRLRGERVRLEQQPMDLLILLVERRGQLVSREEIVRRLWGAEVFVDVSAAVNTAIHKVRDALRGSKGAPIFIETVPGKGYRFVATVEVAMNASESRPPLRLAVLPFESIGPGPEGDYLVDGLTEEAIASLGRIDPSHLTVIGRTSTMLYKGTKKSLAKIGEELNVDYLLEGSIRKESTRLRITARLNRVRDQVQVWSASFDREPAGLLSLQQDLSTAIAQQVSVQLSPERITAISRRQTRNADAYDLYLRGRRFWHQLTPATTWLAIEHFTRATTLDPDYALAWAGIAEAFASSPVNGDAPPEEASARAIEAASQAMRADSSLAEAQHVFGQLKFFLEWDWPAAEAAYRRAIGLDGSFAFAHSMLGHLLSQRGRHNEALLLMRQARELDPLSAVHQAMSSQVAFQAGDYAAALDHAERAIAIDPEFWVGFMMRGQAHEQVGHAEMALKALAAAARLSGGNSKPISTRGYVLARQGRRQEAREVIAMLQDVGRHRYVPPYATALIHAGLDEPEAVFASLEQALVARDVHLVFLPVDPKWNGLRDYPEFQSLLARCGFGGG